jgi:hypothetical protein
MQTDKKKEYDRQYKQTQYEEFRKLKDWVTEELFEGECFLCGTQEGHTEFHLHHLRYHPEDSSYARNSKAQWTRNLRLKEAIEHPERFRLLCPACHRMVTTLGNHIIRKTKAADKKRDVDLDLLLNLVVMEVKNRQEEIYEL